MFHFNKLLTLNKLKIQNDVLTKELIKAKGFKQASNIGNIIRGGIFIYGLTSCDTAVKTAGHVAMAASNMLSRVGTLVNVGYGEDLQSDYTDDPRSGYTDLGTNYTDSQNDCTILKNSLVNVTRKLTAPLEKICEAVSLIQEEKIDEERGTLNK